MSDIREEGKKKKLKLKLSLLWNSHKIRQDDLFRSKDGTNNRSRRTNGVKRSADLPPPPFPFVSFGRTKPPNEKHLVTFDSELIRLKSNKKPLLNASQQFLELHLSQSVDFIFVGLKVVEDDVLHIDADGHISVSHRHDYLRQRVLQLFGNIDGLAIFQSVATDEKWLIITFVSLSPFSSWGFWKILWHWFVIGTFRFSTLLFWLRAFYLALFSFHGNTLWNKFSDGNGIYLAVLFFLSYLLLLLYNSLFISLSVYLPMKMNTSAIEDMPNSRLVPAGLHPFVHTLSVEMFIGVHQYNHSIVSAFAHSHVQVKESRTCSLIYTLAHIAHRNVILSKTHPSTDIFDSANIWLGDAVISVISFSAYLWR